MFIQENMSDNGSMEANSTEPLRSVDPDYLHRYLTENWSDIRVEAAPPGEKIVKKVHGETKTGDYLVSVGPLLVENHAGTELSAENFVRWMVNDKGFRAVNAEKAELPIQDAVDILNSGAFSVGGAPVVRLLRPYDGKKPGMCFEFYGGSQSDPIKTISTIGNKGDINHDDKRQYRERVYQLIQPIAARGTTEIKKLMGVQMDLGKRRLFDDCLASLITFVGYEKLRDYLGMNKYSTLLEMDGAVGTTQAFVTALVLSEQASKNDPNARNLLVRVGAPAYGLAGKTKGMNYIENTQEDMLTSCGTFTCGDFGSIMSDGREKNLQPSVRLYGNGNPLYETDVFLYGGGPMLEMLERQYTERKKPINGILAIMRASRIGEEKDWGALFGLPEILPKVRSMLMSERMFAGQ